MLLYFTVNFFLAGFVIWDALRRNVSRVKTTLWVAFTIGASAAALPFYFASRPLREGEQRGGGFGWNVVRNYFLLWTVLHMLVGAGMALEFGSAAGIGIFMLVVTWLAPTPVLGIVGFFLKSSVTRTGPTGPLAGDNQENEKKTSVGA